MWPGPRTRCSILDGFTKDDLSRIVSSHAAEHRAEDAHGIERIRVLVAQHSAADLQSFGEQGLRLGETALPRAENREVDDRGEGVRVFDPQGVTLNLHRLFEHAPSFVISALVAVHAGEVIQIRQRVRVFLSQEPAADIEGLEVEGFRLVEASRSRVE